MRSHPEAFLRISRGLCAALLLAVAVPAAADHYPAVRKGIQRKDQGVLDSLRRLTHTEFYTMTLEPFWCDCLEPTCEADFMIACGGEVSPSNGGWVSAARRTSRETCFVCGCAGPEPVELQASPVCVGF